MPAPVLLLSGLHDLRPKGSLAMSIMEGEAGRWAKLQVFVFDIVNLFCPTKKES